MFEFIVKKVKERTSGWHHKFLSEGGKEVLLKAVALAMPTYAMSCFKLPVSICEEIDYTLSKFWWGSDNGKRKMSWVGEETKLTQERRWSWL
ncbi:putative ribonuclease H protein [Cardamine amara subsp. amara]|uniref:Ribonuclease H protein n=1 Tax=Cardamine amara subsp. amara TaxID=228776 RepID=A0ABD1AZV5_CARAN